MLVLLLLLQAAVAQEKVVFFEATTPLSTLAGDPVPSWWQDEPLVFGVDWGTRNDKVEVETVRVPPVELFDAQGQPISWSTSCAIWTPGLTLRLVIDASAVVPGTGPEHCGRMPEAAGSVGPAGHNGGRWLAEGSPLLWSDGSQAGRTVDRLPFVDTPAQDGRVCAGWSPETGFTSEDAPVVLCAPESALVGPPSRVFHWSQVPFRRKAKVRYPSEMYPTTASCTVRVEWNVEGVPTRAEATECPHAFAAEAERALLEARFHPPEMEGEPVAGNMLMRVQFRP